MLLAALLVPLFFEACLDDLFNTDEPDPPGEPDVKAPFVIIQSPTSEPSYSTIDQYMTINGLAEDDRSLRSVRFKINNGDIYDAQGKDEWTADNIVLMEGDNTFVVYAEDESNNSSSDTLLITRNKYLIFLGAPYSNPSGVFMNEATEVTISVQIFPNLNLIENSVELVRLDANNNEAEVIGPLYDDGNLQHGDEIKGDNIFSAKNTFTLDKDTKYRVKAKTSENEGEVTGFSAVFSLKAYQPIDDSETEEILNTLEEAAEKLNEFIAGNDYEQTIELTKEWLESQPNVVSVNVSEGGYEILHSCGVISLIVINIERADGSFTQGGYAPDTQKERKSTIPLRQQTTGENSSNQFCDEMDDVILDRDVLIWEPFQEAFSPQDKGEDLKKEFSESDFEFNVVHLKNQECTIASLDNLTSYGFVFFDTHGIDGKWLLTGELVVTGKYELLRQQHKVALSKKVAYKEDWTGFSYDSGFVYAVSDLLITGLKGSFPNSVIFNSSCNSLAYPYLSSAFFAKEAKVYLGVNNTVDADFMKTVSRQFVNNLVVDEDNAYDAYSWIPNKSDPKPPHALLVIRGKHEMHYSKDLVNGDFECGDLSGWTKLGDGRVITRLGNQFPTQGNFIGIISTGLGNTTASGQISQAFRVREHQTNLHIKWNFFSEEFMEYVGSQYQDYFSVIIELDGVQNVVFIRNIDAFANQYSLSQVSPGIVFDKGDVYMTGWQEISLDITAYQKKDIILRLQIGDVGDSVYDSAVLLDEIYVE